MEEGKQIDSAKRKATLEWIDNAVEQVKLVLQKRAKDRTLRQNKGKEPVDIKKEATRKRAENKAVRTQRNLK